jgi:hypothetical protein
MSPVAGYFWVLAISHIAIPAASSTSPRVSMALNYRRPEHCLGRRFVSDFNNLWNWPTP